MNRAIDVEALGWNPDWVGELDHRRLRTPSVQLRSARHLAGGDAIYCVGLRVRPPNSGVYLSDTQLHSVEHFLLEGGLRLLPEHFIGVGIMGCRTGFYLTFVNEGRAELICAVLAQIFEEMHDAIAVPFARIDQCGHWQNHDLALAQGVARECLARRNRWLDAA